MFGFYRYLLAHLVMLAHLSGPLYAGPYAVFSFWMLSGWLMTLVLNESYGFTVRGVARYLANRALRIYPPYLMALALGGAVLALTPRTPYRAVARNPDDLLGWLHNIAILGVHVDRKARDLTISAIWSVDIELFFYIGLALGLARSRRVAQVWFCVSLLYTVGLLVGGAPFPIRYSNLAAASLPYATGALLYHQREPLRRWLRGRYHALLALALYGANVILGWPAPLKIGFYVSLAITAYVVTVLGALDPRKAPKPLARIDRLLGDLSYPLFLCHMSVGILLVVYGVEPRSTELVLWALLPANLLALLIHLLAERPVAALRARVRAARDPRRTAAG